MNRHDPHCNVINLDMYFLAHPERKMKSFGQQTPNPRPLAAPPDVLPLGWRLTLSWLAIFAGCWLLVVCLLYIGGVL